MAIHPPGNVLPEERTVLGTRKDAEITARSMIDAWLRKRRRQDFDAGGPSRLGAVIASGMVYCLRAFR